MKAIAEHDLTVYQGDVREQLAALEAGAVQCVVTSPPYYGLRDYGVDGQIGLEASPAEYVAELVGVFREVRRVLADDGVCWLNLGDSYSGGNRTSCDTKGGNRETFVPRVDASRPVTGIPGKNLLGIPWQVARAMQEPYYTGKIRNEADRAWLAGWIDGEGTISYVERDRGPDHTSTHDVRVFVTNCDDGPLRYFADICGGRVNVHDDGTRENRYGTRTVYRWHMGTHDSALVLREVYPYLRTKRRQAALIWTLFTTLRHQNGHARTPAAAVARRREIAAMVRTLNAGGDVTLPEWVEEPPSATEPGWYLRNAVIWAKPNAMPESVTDRLSTRYEHVFLLSKSRRYYFDLDAIKVPTTMRAPGNTIENRQQYGSGTGTGAGGRRFGGNPTSTLLDIHETRNPGDVWTVPTSPFPGAHFATMPPELARRCILAGCPQNGTVLDPFAGSGTTLMVARKLGRKAVGVELNPDYIDIIRQRIGQTPLDFGETA